MKIAIFIIAALVTYLICAINPAILFSKLIYHKDIREEGSGNPGFTNFKRVFGMKFAWLVFLLDISKGILLELLFGFLFAKIFADSPASAFWMNYRLLGIAYSGLFATLGHTVPIWYKFKGGKGFLVCISTLFMLDWKCGLFAFIILSIFLLTTHYMSLATIIAMIAGTVLLPFMKVPLIPVIIFAACVIFMIYRHHENIKRLANGSEKKFYFFKKSGEEIKTDNSSDDKTDDNNEISTDDNSK
ncbi:MAG: glycerol-3-phosphate 1-O-acyltransferase PlsY [Treponema sp.]|nr:glycerol-3-phosphate 1-O-acyltransferase PlsY [Treponema sp.]